ncbi:hypothetical protein [Microbaculum marinisediminis]|uniref:DUF1828 domain-containing protein n=1 Tax=Microbaculum marinisediminis TaxID=2931392 RepID=A0AAW5QVJ5_9HYPH|nr:hypothetical protein [Microbaculum sp. A6E488]MCT8971227.1 hypothetical protein [Microbaculum sp. A6E488]
MMPLNPSEVEIAIRALIVAEKTNLGIEVSVPVAYPDGDIVTVVIERSGYAFRVHDAGFGAMHAAAAGFPLTKSHTQKIANLIQRYRCSFVDGRVMAKCSYDALAITACLVANASRTAADQATEIRRLVEVDFRLLVSDKLREAFGERVRENESIVGRSGRQYRVPAIILDPTQSRPRNFVSPLAHRNTVPHSFAMFFDLRGAFPDVENDTVFDDAGDFRQEDRALLESVSTVIGAMEVSNRFRAAVGQG